MDQIGNGSGLGATWVSQYFEPVFSAYDVAALDNFAVAAPTAIRRVDVVFDFFASSNPTYSGVQSWSVQIYSSPVAAALDLTGNLGSATVLPGSVSLTTGFGGGSAALVSIPVDIPVPAGNLWVAVIPRIDYSTYGELGVVESTSGFPQTSGAYQSNPGVGFGGTVLYERPDLAYRVEAIPEPATWTALLGGIAVLALRRYRAASRYARFRCNSLGRQ